MSAIGSVMVIGTSNPSRRGSLRGLRRRDSYQEAFETPGSSPRCAMSRMQIRHSPNLRYTALGRPHRWHRVYARTGNFGFAAALLISAFLAMSVLLEREAQELEQRPALIVGGGRGHNGEVHAPGPVDPA